ncbi:MAG TPA: hypothetical protein VJU80_04870 [Solirubrobacteraceae bacterium]|nr:hypothetical protein [Solirubrobacteraceae bacterium]
MSAPQGKRQATAEHVITVEYSDVRELLRWRQTFRVAEILTVRNRTEGSTVYPDLIA